MENGDENEAEPNDNNNINIEGEEAVDPYDIENAPVEAPLNQRLLPPLDIIHRLRAIRRRHRHIELHAFEAQSDSDNSDLEMGAGTSRNNDEQRRERVLNKMTFDRNLPTTHQYLGGDLEELEAGRTIYEVDSIVTNIALFPLPSIVLMPGQTLPIQTLNLRAISMFRLIIEHRKIFGAVHVENVQGETVFAKVGTLAQVLAFKEQTQHETTTMCLKAIGRQRFELLSKRRTIDGSWLCTILILPEIILSPFLYSATPQSWLKLALNKGAKNDPKSKNHSNYRASLMTPFSWQLIKQYDLDVVLQDCVSELAQFYDGDKVKTMAENAVQFSFWIASNLPVEDSMKLKLLQIDSALARLRLELVLMKKGSEYVCRACKLRICYKKDIFSMSLSGPMGAYVNNHGHMHEMATFMHAHNTAIMSRPTSENSWFPGYAWSILNCLGCMSHLGWKFIAESRNLKPSKFWGITRAAIMPQLNIAEPQFMQIAQENIIHDNNEDHTVQ